jgi:hypothetical protein
MAAVGRRRLRPRASERRRSLIVRAHYRPHVGAHARFVTDCFNVPKPLDLGAKAVYSTYMNNETTLPVYDSLEALLAAELPQAPVPVAELSTTP